MPRSTLALRLAVAFAVVGVTAAAVTALLVNLAFQRRFDAYLDDQRQRGEIEIAALLEDAYRASGSWEGVDLGAVGFGAAMSGFDLRVENTEGRTVVPSLGEGTFRMAEMHREMMGIGALGPERQVRLEVDGKDIGVALVRLPRGGLRPQDVALRSSVNKMLMGGGLAAAVVAFGVGAVLAHRTTAPVAELTAAARQLAAGNRDSRVSSDRSDELGDMSRAFNHLADQIEEEDRLRRVFTADVAHELRTPLTILRSGLESLQDGMQQPTPATVGSLHEEVLRLSRLVADLEALASADAAGFSLDLQPVALAPLLEQVAESFQGAFHARDQRSEVDISSGAIVRADRTRLVQVVSNLLSNATKFTAPGGEVALRLDTEGAFAVISVRDSGCGIPPEEMSAVFDRFYRGRDVRAGGSGIGLAVVRQLVEAHGGEIGVQTQQGVGTTFTIRLPTISAAPSRRLHQAFTADP